MGLDIRLPIGILFGVVGALLAGFGIFGPQQIYGPSLNINVNLGWGGVLFAFGATMFCFGWRAARRKKAS